VNARVCCIILALLCFSDGASRAAGGVGQTRVLPPTFNRDIAPILFTHCVTCHRPEGVAPMSLLTFEQARSYAKPIQEKVTAREMPPWYADQRFGQFKNVRGLTPAQIDVLSAWVDGGTPQGDGSPPSPPMSPPNGWQVPLNRPPDAVLDLPFGEFDLPAQGEVPTFTVWMKLPFKDDRFIQAIEMRPSVRNAVHHSSMSLGPLPPGTTNGLAKRFGRDDYLAWGLHLMSTGRVEKLRVQIGLWPHMHNRGKDMTFVVTRPDGKQETLLSVPRYNPHWQITYELASPLKVRKGSTITASGHYDNSAKNPHNPAPDAEVRFGPQSTDEMYIPFMEVSVDNDNLRLKRLEEFLR